MQLLNYNNVTKPVDLVPLDSINHKKPIWKCQNLKKLIDCLSCSSTNHYIYSNLTIIIKI